MKLGAEDLSRYSNEIESVGLRKHPYLTKCCHNNRHFQSLIDKRHRGKTAGIDMVLRNYVTVTLCT